MSTIAAFIIGLICGVTFYALLDCAYCWGKRVGRESATAQTDAGEREHTDVECCGGAHTLRHPAANSRQADAPG